MESVYHGLPWHALAVIYPEMSGQSGSVIMATFACS